MPVWRARTSLTKEPETLEWINTFEDADVLWDIGANVGVYSLYAALRRLTVLAFEPSSANSYVLSRNVEINKMDDRVSTFCLAFNNMTKWDLLYMSDTQFGGALSSFSHPVDIHGKSLKVPRIRLAIND